MRWVVWTCLALGGRRAVRKTAPQAAPASSDVDLLEEAQAGIAVDDGGGYNGGEGIVYPEDDIVEYDEQWTGSNEEDVDPLYVAEEEDSFLTEVIYDDEQNKAVDGDEQGTGEGDAGFVEEGGEGDDDAIVYGLGTAGDEPTPEEDLEFGGTTSEADAEVSNRDLQKEEKTTAKAEGEDDDDDNPEKIYEKGLYPKDEDFKRQVNCDFSRPEWQQYRHVYEVALNREDTSDDPDQLLHATRVLSSVLWARARNVTDILTCNVGIIAGYQRLSHALLVAGLGPKTALYRYRLLQLALIFIFTLRNANKIPPVAGEYWAASEQYIIPNIMAIRRHVEQQELQRRREREWFTGRTVSNTFRDPDMRIAIVSICAYPPTSDIALKDVTPLNRELYARKHGYALRLHTEPPLLGGNVHIQHAKLATVNHYIRSGDFDWVVWFDCDSLIMNLDHTLDSIIYRAAGKWTSNNFAGEWADTWDPNTITIVVNETEVTASAQQFGTARGFMRGKILHMTFENSLDPLEGELVNSEEGDVIHWSNGAVWHRTRAIEPCLSPQDCPELKGLDDSIDLLITEEGWGLSSANWMVRRSAWTINFLDECLNVAHVKIPLFGDQDAIIYLVMNDQTLRGLTDALADPAAIRDSDEELPDPLDSHVRVIPQRELNAYDHLNAYTMDVDGYQFGDLLITFPQCKDASCNTLFRLAAEYAHERDEFAYNPHDWAHVRLFGPRDLVAMWWKRHMEEERKQDREEEEDEKEKENIDEGEEEGDASENTQADVPGTSRVSVRNGASTEAGLDLADIDPEEDTGEGQEERDSTVEGEMQEDGEEVLEEVEDDSANEYFGDPDEEPQDDAEDDDAVQEEEL
ncbi:unnamed protein product [Amoebophrya sp. A25]|nr:unnamed protein product [Amoebophrya sp. A25]|eukprot:GSA25T00009082001.1